VAAWPRGVFHGRSLIRNPALKLFSWNSKKKASDDELEVDASDVADDADGADDDADASSSKSRSGQGGGKAGKSSSLKGKPSGKSSGKAGRKADLKGKADADAADGDEPDAEASDVADDKAKKKKGPPEVVRDSRKAKRFFEHAQARADGRNYDYAIELYINGLRHDPDNMRMHETLREVSLKRKVGGGKPEGLFGGGKVGTGKDPIDKFLAVERKLAKDPLNLSLMLELMKKVNDADAQTEEYNLGELSYWVGNLVREANETSKPPSRAELLRLKDLFVEIEVFGKAIDAVRLALVLKPEDSVLQKELRDLEALRTMKDGGYAESAQKVGGFRDVVKDMDKQRDLEQQDQRTKSEKVLDEQIERRRAELEEDPNDPTRMARVVELLSKKDTEEAEQECFDLLRQAHEASGQYRYKVQLGDLRMRQFNRELRELKQKADRGDAKAKKALQAKAAEKLQFELKEFSERVKNYPTDLALRYHLGKRLFAAKRYDEAIAALQMSKNDAKHRGPSLELLGRCYITQGWLEEAIDTLRQGVEAQSSSEDASALTLRYLLMAALEKSARENHDIEQAREAQKYASQILQTDISFRDIRDRMTKLRELIKTQLAEQQKS